MSLVQYLRRFRETRRIARRQARSWGARFIEVYQGQSRSARANRHSGGRSRGRRLDADCLLELAEHRLLDLATRGAESDGIR